MADTDFKDLTRRTAFDKVFCDKAFNIAKNPKDDRYQRGLASMIYKFFSKKTYATRGNKFDGSGIKNENISSKELAEWLHKPIIKKFKKRKVRSVIDIFSKYTWIIPLKDKKGITISNTFQTISKEFNCKPNKIWVDKGTEFYKRSMKSFLQKNNIEMYLTHNEGKSVVTEQFIKTLKNKIYK